MMRTATTRKITLVRRLTRLKTLALVAGLTFITTGCTEELETRYGEMSGEGAQSVNGVSVLAELFKKAGHKVSPAYTLTPKLRARAEVIVWFPDSFEPPSDTVRGWFETWLRDGDRTLIYVGRDYDAAITYWDTLLPTLAKDSTQAAEMRIALAAARLRLATRRQTADRIKTAAPASFDDSDDWFQLDYGQKQTKAGELDGAEAWVDQIDAARCEIELTTRIEPHEYAEILLETETGEPLVSTVNWHETPDGQSFGRIIVVANGSFLLNLPLVNHEHRKLAGRLIDEIGTESRDVVFLESGRSGPNVADDDETMRSGLEILTIAPFDLILLHLSIAGVIFAFGRWPIFGLARPWTVEHGGDFGQHVAALGRLMQATRNRDYAEERLRQYQQLPRSDVAGTRKQRKP